MGYIFCITHCGDSPTLSGNFLSVASGYTNLPITLNDHQRKEELNYTCSFSYLMSFMEISHF